MQRAGGVDRDAHVAEPKAQRADHAEPERQAAAGHGRLPPARPGRPPQVDARAARGKRHASHRASSTSWTTRSAKPMPDIGGLLGHQRDRRHAGLGVDLEQVEAVRIVRVEAEVGAGHAAAAERPMRAQRMVEGALVDLRRQRRGNEVLGLVGGVLGVIVEEAVAVHDLGDRERPVAEHAYRELAAGDVALDQDLAAIRPVVAVDRRLARIAHDPHADARAFAVGLDDIGDGAAAPRRRAARRSW